MQKKLIALAVAGIVSGGAFAQSNVTLYGRIDTVFLHTSASGGQSSNGLENGGLAGSRLGFTGEEDLGGLKAVFRFEVHVQSDGNSRVLSSATGPAAATAATTYTRGNRTWDTRQSYVGLTGGWGTFIGGRLNAPAFEAVTKYDAMAASFASPLYGLTLGAGFVQNSAARVDNAVSYISPKFSGLTLTGTYAFAGTADEIVKGSTLNANGAANAGGATNTAQEKVVSLRADYSNGPLNVGYTHHRVDDQGNTISSAVSESTTRANHFGASYNFGMASVIGSWQDNKATVARVETKRTIWQLGVVVPVGKGNVRASYVNLDQNRSLNDAKGFGLQYDYSLSKRTTVYVAGTRISNDGAAVYKSVLGFATPTAGGNATAWGTGIAHTF